jgi:hypothetical protein
VLRRKSLELFRLFINDPETSQSRLIRSKKQDESNKTRKLRYLHAYLLHSPKPKLCKDKNNTSIPAKKNRNNTEHSHSKKAKTTLCTIVFEHTWSLFYILYTLRPPFNYNVSHSQLGQAAPTNPVDRNPVNLNTS